jgi:two-component system response regulator AtoC
MKRDEATDTVQWSEARRCLVAVWGGGSAQRPLPDEGTIVIGRGAECDLRIDHPSVSRTHATLRVQAGNVLLLEDLESSNGTRVRGKALAPGVPSPVTPDDIVEVGAARILVEFPGAPRHERAAVGDDGTMDRVGRLVDLVAPSDISVLLQGETGVGKEVTAETIHRLSPRSSRPMVRVNCAGLSDALLESELFGHERGAFTGAVAMKPGLLEVATGGTVFLDEVSEMPVTTQAKLLRALESREVRRVGGVKAHAVDVRFIAASNRDLKTQCDREAFRFDLYFRLNGITITIPPLRRRAAQIRGLAETLIARRCATTGRPAPALTRDAVEHLERHTWPGNVRELRNVVERALLLSPNGPIGPQHLPIDEPDAAPAIRAAPDREVEAPSPASSPQRPLPLPLPLKQELDAIERQRIVAALAECGGNQTKAARLLGIPRRTLLTRLDAWGLPRPRK